MSKRHWSRDVGPKTHAAKPASIGQRRALAPVCGSAAGYVAGPGGRVDCPDCLQIERSNRP